MKKTGPKPPPNARADVERVLDLVSTGVSFSAACDQLKLVRRTILSRIEADEELTKAKERAIEMGSDALADECLLIADKPEIGEEEIQKPDGAKEIRRGDMLGHRRLRIDTRLRLIGKWNQHKYGDRAHIEHGGAITTKRGAADMTDDELAAIAAGRAKPPSDDA